MGKGSGGIQVLDKEHAKEVHQQCADAEAEKTEEGDRVGAEAPVEFALLGLEGLVFHGECRQTAVFDRGVVYVDGMEMLRVSLEAVRR